MHYSFSFLLLVMVARVLICFGLVVFFGGEEEGLAIREYSFEVLLHVLIPSYNATRPEKYVGFSFIPAHILLLFCGFFLCEYMLIFIMIFSS